MNATQLPSLHIVAGARPNFMKIAPIVRALRADGRLAWKIIHTGQHFDRNMSEVFFEELDLPAPDVNFNCGGGTHAFQTARVMEAFEAHCDTDRPDAVLVVGDVNSTMACAIVAKKMCIPVIHVEAGLRSGDMRMPEEVNRIVTDSISDWFFVTEPAGVNNLLHEGHARDRIFHVGHVMADNVVYQVARLKTSTFAAFETEAIKQRIGARYGVLTLHRPSNVDRPEKLSALITALNRISVNIDLIFPVHPRTRVNMLQANLKLSDRIHLLDPQPYMSFLHLWKDATLVLTDSGGLQEETTALGVPCITIRDNTERPITVDEGTNTVAGTEPESIVRLALQTLNHGGKRGRIPELWDGNASQRIISELVKIMY